MDPDLNDVVNENTKVGADISKSSQLPTIAEKKKLWMKKVLESHSRVGVYSVEDVSVVHDAEDNPNPMFYDEHDLEHFKKFDTIIDHSDHLFSAYTSPMKQPEPPKVWEHKIQEDRRILKKDLPDTMYVRVYKSRMDLLRAAIIGPKGTPYHDGLFFFDVYFPSNYPNSPPLVRYHSGGLGIHPNVFKCGEVRLRLFKPFGCEGNDIWVPGTSNVLQLLVSIQNLILCSHPFLNGFGFAYLRGSVDGENLSLLYNENTLIKSLKTMVYTMHKPLKYFEDLVVGHFCKNVICILKACEAYTEGLQVGCFNSEEGNKETCCSIKFKIDVAKQIKPLVAAFKGIGAIGAEDFLHLSEKINLLHAASSEPTNVLKKSPDTGHYRGTIVAPSAGKVVKVLITDGMKVKKGKHLLVWDRQIKLPTISEENKSRMKKVLESHSRVGMYSVEDVSAVQDAEINPMARLDDEHVPKKFKKFDTVIDHSDHLFSAYTSPVNQPEPPKVWEQKIQEDRRILKKDLPDTMYVRVYESRMDLLRAAIIGPKGTPYHDGLFFFDVYFPSNYPNSPPLVRYHSGGLGIHPNVFKCGEVRLNLFKPFGCEGNDIWVPGTSNVLQLLVSIQDLILCSHPFLNGFGFAYLRGSVDGENFSLLYNENTLIKSLKTMVYTMNKPPKYYEDLVVGHFCKNVICILKACEAYTEGLQVGCFDNEEGNKETCCSIEFKNDVSKQIKPLVAAFNGIGAIGAEDFRHLSEKINLLHAASSEPTNVLKKSPDSRHVCRCNFNAPYGFEVDKVHVKEGMEVEKGHPFFVLKAITIEEDTMDISSSATQSESSLCELSTISEWYKSLIHIPRDTPGYEDAVRRYRYPDLKFL